MHSKWCVYVCLLFVLICCAAEDRSSRAASTCACAPNGSCQNGICACSGDYTGAICDQVSQSSFNQFQDGGIANLTLLSGTYQTDSGAAAIQGDAKWSITMLQVVETSTRTGNWVLDGYQQSAQADATVYTYSGSIQPTFTGPAITGSVVFYVYNQSSTFFSNDMSTNYTVAAWTVRVKVKINNWDAASGSSTLKFGVLLHVDASPSNTDSTCQGFNTQVDASAKQRSFNLSSGGAEVFGQIYPPNSYTPTITSSASTAVSLAVQCPTIFQTFNADFTFDLLACPPPPVVKTTSNDSNSKTKIIVGAVFGAIGFVLIVGLSIWKFIRHREAQQADQRAATKMRIKTTKPKGKRQPRASTTAV